jgi:hypothetical protein
VAASGESVLDVGISVLGILWGGEDGTEAKGADVDGGLAGLFLLAGLPFALGFLVVGLKILDIVDDVSCVFG